MRTLEDRNRSIGTVLILVAMVVIFGLVLYWMYSVKLLILPDFLAEFLNISDPNTEVTDILDTEELSGILKSGKSSNKVSVNFEVNYQNLREAMLTDKSPEGLYQLARISYYSDDEKKSTRTALYKNGVKFRVEKYSGDNSNKSNLVSQINATENAITYLDNITGETRSISRNSSIIAENEAGFPSVDSLLTVVAAFPETAVESMQSAVSAQINESDENAELSNSTVYLPDSEEKYSDCQLALLQTENGSLYYVAYTDKELEIKEEYFVSLEYRVILEQRTYSKEKLIYSFETIDFSVDPEIWNAD